jgi:hypothetical protein
VNPKAKRFAEAISWGAVFAVAITGAIHVAAVKLPEHFSARGGRQASAMEQKANAFSSYWLGHSPVLPAEVTIACFVLFAVLWLLLRRPKVSTPRGSGAG